VRRREPAPPSNFIKTKANVDFPGLAVPLQQTINPALPSVFLFCQEMLRKGKLSFSEKI